MKTLEAQPIRFHHLGTDDIGEIVALHRLAIGRAPPGTLRPDESDFFVSIIERGGLIFGMRARESLVAYGVLSLAPASAMKYAASVGFREIDSAGIVCLDGVTVHPDWRGNDLHGRLGRWRIEAARALGRRHLFSTAAPINDASWATLLRLGLHVRAIGEFYGGMLRYVVYRDLHEVPKLVDPASAIAVPVGDLDRQRQALAAGMVGWRRWIADGRVFLVLGHSLAA
jgi:hypothetical protein